MNLALHSNSVACSWLPHKQHQTHSALRPFMVKVPGKRATFEEREARSKLTYFRMVEHMQKHSWPKMVLESAQMSNIKLSAMERLRKLKLRYDCQDETIKRDLGREAPAKAYKKHVD